MRETGRSYRRYIIPAVCAALALAGIAAAYQLGRAGGNSIGQEAAKTAALAHAGVSEADLSRYEIALDESGGAPVYRVEFETDLCAYDYAVSAADGSIVKFSRETGDSGAPVQPGQDEPAAPPAQPEQGESAAPDTPPASDASSPDSSTPAALTGASESAAPSAPANTPAPAAPAQPEENTASLAASGDYIGEAMAWEIAFSHAGVTADSALHCGIEMDHARHHSSHGHHSSSNCCVYEVDFHCGGYGYEYKIDALTGAILDFEQELDD